MTNQTKKCPMCAETIPADEVFCPYCGTRFGEEIPAPPSVQTAPCPPVSPAPLARKSNAGLWIGGGALALILVCAIVGIVLWTQRAKIPAFAGLLATPTSTPTLPPTLTPTITSTRTPRPTTTATPLPAWVTDFAQPILDAIADRPPSFQDNFGPGSAGWQAPDWCGRRMKYVEGEMVVTDCRLFRPNINYSDFVIEFDGRFFDGAASDSRWSLHFRHTGGPAHIVSFHYNGNVNFSFFEGGNYEFPNAAKSGTQSNHILIIGKGSRFAIFLNNTPFFEISVPLPNYGDFKFFADETILAIDNLKIWNIADIQAP